MNTGKLKPQNVIWGSKTVEIALRYPSSQTIERVNVRKTFKSKTIFMSMDDEWKLLFNYIACCNSKFVVNSFS